MQTPTSLIVSLMILTVGGAPTAWAASHPLVMAQAESTKTVDPTKNADPIKGADVMGDKNRSGPDGWIQAPVSRDEAPAANTKSAGEAPKPTASSAPTSSKPMKPGDDPATPVNEPGRGPGQRTAAPN